MRAGPQVRCHPLIGNVERPTIGTIAGMVGYSDPTSGMVGCSGSGMIKGVYNPIRRRRERSARIRHLAKLNACPECGHNWGEHGFDNDVDGVCGECAYEIEHGLRPSEPSGCRLTPPSRSET